MKNLKDYTHYISDLKRQHDLNSRRYYNRDSEAIILKLIAKELSGIPLGYEFPKNLYVSLARIDKTNSVDIEKMCEIYRRIILLKSEERE